jgi:hypothetical protein
MEDAICYLCLARQGCTPKSQGEASAAHTLQVGRSLLQVGAKEKHNLTHYQTQLLQMPTVLNINAPHP